MKNLILSAILLFCATLSCKAQNNIESYSSSICPYGFSDKPIDAIAVTLNKKDMLESGPFNKVILTDVKTLKAFVLFVQTHDTHCKVGDKHFGCFEVTIYKRKSLITRYFLNSQPNSKMYLKTFIEMLIENKLDTNVIEELQHIVIRVNH